MQKLHDDFGAKYDFQDVLGRLPLYAALHISDDKKISELMKLPEVKETINVPADNGFTPLMLVLYNDLTAMVDKLIAAGATGTASKKTPPESSAAVVMPDRAHNPSAPS